MKMAPNQSFTLSSVPLEPVSRTYQYRKVMKPLLERKRRARINRCLDELKELMTGAFQAEGENVAKLEKADILELTVRHLHSLRDKNSLFIRKNNNHHQQQQQQQQHHDQINTDRFWDGFRQCAGEVTQYLSKFDTKISIDLLSHINGYSRNMENIQPSTVTSATGTPSVGVATTTTLSSVSPKTKLKSLCSPNSSIRSQSVITTKQLPFAYQQHHLQNHQILANGGGYSDMFLLSSYHYQNKNLYSKDFHDNYETFPSQYCQQKNNIGVDNVWRPW